MGLGWVWGGVEVHGGGVCVGKQGQEVAPRWRGRQPGSGEGGGGGGRGRAMPPPPASGHIPVDCPKKLQGDHAHGHACSPWLNAWRMHTDWRKCVAVGWPLAASPLYTPSFTHTCKVPWHVRRQGRQGQLQPVSGTLLPRPFACFRTSSLAPGLNACKRTVSATPPPAICIQKKTAGFASCQTVHCLLVLSRTALDQRKSCERDGPSPVSAPRLHPAAQRRPGAAAAGCAPPAATPPAGPRRPPEPAGADPCLQVLQSSLPSLADQATSACGGPDRPLHAAMGAAAVTSTQARCKRVSRLAAASDTGSQFARSAIAGACMHAHGRRQASSCKTPENSMGIRQLPWQSTAIGRGKTESWVGSVGVGVPGSDRHMKATRPTAPLHALPGSHAAPPNITVCLLEAANPWPAHGPSDPRARLTCQRALRSMRQRSAIFIDTEPRPVVPGQMHRPGGKQVRHTNNVIVSITAKPHLPLHS